VHTLNNALVWIDSRNDWTVVRKGILIQPLSSLKSLNNPFQSLSIGCCISSHFPMLWGCLRHRHFRRVLLLLRYVAQKNQVIMKWRNRIPYSRTVYTVIVSTSASSNWKPILHPEFNRVFWTKRSPRLDLTSLSKSPRNWRSKLRRDVASTLNLFSIWYRRFLLLSRCLQSM